MKDRQISSYCLFSGVLTYIRVLDHLCLIGSYLFVIMM